MTWAIYQPELWIPSPYLEAHVYQGLCSWQQSHQAQYNSPVPDLIKYKTLIWTCRSRWNLCNIWWVDDHQVLTSRISMGVTQPRTTPKAKVIFCKNMSASSSHALHCWGLDFLKLICSQPRDICLSFISEDKTRERWGMWCKVMHYVKSPQMVIKCKSYHFECKLHITFTLPLK